MEPISSQEQTLTGLLKDIHHIYLNSVFEAEKYKNRCTKLEKAKDQLTAKLKELQAQYDDLQQEPVTSCDKLPKLKQRVNEPCLGCLKLNEELQLKEIICQQLKSKLASTAEERPSTPDLYQGMESCHQAESTVTVEQNRSTPVNSHSTNSSPSTIKQTSSPEKCKIADIHTGTVSLYNIFSSSPVFNKHSSNSLTSEKRQLFSSDVSQNKHDRESSINDHLIEHSQPITSKSPESQKKSARPQILVPETVPLDAIDESDMPSSSINETPTPSAVVEPEHQEPVTASCSATDRELTDVTVVPSTVIEQRLDTTLDTTGNLHQGQSDYQEPDPGVKSQNNNSAFKSPSLFEELDFISCVKTKSLHREVPTGTKRKTSTAAIDSSNTPRREKTQMNDVADSCNTLTLPPITVLQDKLSLFSSRLNDQRRDRVATRSGRKRISLRNTKTLTQMWNVDFISSSADSRRESNDHDYNKDSDADDDCCSDITIDIGQATKKTVSHSQSACYDQSAEKNFNCPIAEQRINNSISPADITNASETVVTSHESSQLDSSVTIHSLATESTSQSIIGVIKPVFKLSSRQSNTESDSELAPSQVTRLGRSSTEGFTPHLELPLNGTMDINADLTRYLSPDHSLSNKPIVLSEEDDSSSDKENGSSISQLTSPPRKKTRSSSVAGDIDSEGEAIQLISDPENLSQATVTINNQSISKNTSRGEVLEDSFDRVPKKPNANFAYKETVRKHAERNKLDGFACRQCEEWYNGLQLSEEEKQKRLKSCRHKSRFAPSSTPPHYWSVNFPTTQECLQRGYIEAQMTRRARPRRRYGLQNVFDAKNQQS